MDKDRFKGYRCTFSINGYKDSTNSKPPRVEVLVLFGGKRRCIYFWSTRQAREALSFHATKHWLRTGKGGTTREVRLIIQSFFKGKPLRSTRVSASVSGRNHSPGGIRDMVEVEDGERIYYLWGSPIARLKGDILTLDNCGYATNLTTERLHRILVASRIRYVHKLRIYPKKQGWRFHGMNVVEKYPLKINTRTGEILNKIYPAAYWKKFLGTKSSCRLSQRYEVCKSIGEIPADLVDKINVKLVAHALTGGAA